MRTRGGPQLRVPGPHAQTTAPHLRFHLRAPGPRPPPARPETARRPVAATSAAGAGATREAKQPAAENASERDVRSRARKRRASGAEQPPAALALDPCHVGNHRGFPGHEDTDRSKAYGRTPEASCPSPQHS